MARRLHHCRDLGSSEPFDFLTWFDFAPADEPRFDELLAALRDTEERRYVEREGSPRQPLGAVVGRETRGSSPAQRLRIAPVRTSPASNLRYGPGTTCALSQPKV